MKLSAVILTIVIAGIGLSGCSHRPHENISFSGEQKSIEFIGNRKITWDDTTVRIPWYRLDADYNIIETNEFWKKITVPSGTEATCVSRYGEIEWTEWDDEVEAMMVAKGFDFSSPDEYSVPPGPGIISIGWWIYAENTIDKPMPFKFGRYYVFCFDRQLVEEKLNGGKEFSFDMNTTLEHITAIIEINPTFDYSIPSTSSPLHLTKENLLSFRENYMQIPELEFGVVKKGNNQFEYLIPEGNGSLPAKPEEIQKLLYAINTSTWEQKKSLHHFKEPADMRTVIEYLDNEGSRKEAIIIEYDDKWYMKHTEKKYYSTDYPYLLDEVKDNAAYYIGNYIIGKEIENNPEDVEAWTDRAHRYEWAGDIEKACFDFKRVCELGDCRKYLILCLGTHSPYAEELIDQELLEKIAVEDEVWEVRVAALRAMARQRPDEITRKFIEQRAAQDESSQAQDEISKILLEKWPDIKE